jgi:membrane protease YdiL (CAAX protease family)
VLGLSLGRSGVFALLALLDRLTAGPPLGEQEAAMNRAVSPRPWLDVLYQVSNLVFALVPVVLVLYLLANVPRRPQDPPGLGDGSMRTSARLVGFDLTQPWRDVRWGVVLAAGIGVPGLGFYFLGRAMGITVQISTNNLGEQPWTVPLLIAAAIENGILEEVVAVGYLLTRLRLLDKLGQHRWARIGLSALLRGSYHLYQGFGPFIGNVAMGVVFAWWFERTERVMPLVVAHSLIDIVAFLGPELVDVNGIG